MESCSKSRLLIQQLDSSPPRTTVRPQTGHLWSDTEEKPKLTIRSTHCGGNVVTRDERSGSESSSMVSGATSGEHGGGGADFALYKGRLF